MDAMQGGEVALVAKGVAAYLLGGIMGGDVIRQLMGGDSLRDSGSGNVGASNALRTRGWKFALGVLVIDLAKGMLAVLLLAGLSSPTAPHVLPYSTVLPFVCGFAAVLGHCYPAFAGFHGGRGVATAAGVTIAALPAATPWMLVAFGLTILLCGYASVASLVAAATVTIWVAAASGSGIVSPAGCFAIAICVLLFFKHRENVLRLRAGTEGRFKHVRVLGRLMERAINRAIRRPESRPVARIFSRLFGRMAGAWRVG